MKMEKERARAENPRGAPREMWARFRETRRDAS